MRTVAWYLLGTLVFMGVFAPLVHAQPTTITFFGQSVTADGYYFCLDASSSMRGVASLERTKSEVRDALLQLAPTDQFGVVAFGAHFQSFDSTALPATAANVQAAIIWLDTVSNLGTSCGGAGGVAAVALAHQGTTSQRRLLVVSDGGWNCPGGATEVPQITNSNWSLIPIDAFHVGTGGANGSLLLQNLANANGGHFTAVGSLQHEFIRGDADADGTLNLADAATILNYLFVGASVSCEAAADTTGDTVVNLVDAIAVIRHLFGLGAPPWAPFPFCGPSFWADECHDFTACP